MSKVLLIDDDSALLRTLAASLKAAGFEVMSAHTGELGVLVATSEHPDIAIVDLGLPKIDGLEVIRRIRAEMTIPILVLSARDQEATKVESLDQGADDYITKPFGIDELIARIRAALRRGVRPDGNTVIETSTFTVDLEAKRVTRDGADVHLTATEWRVLAALIGSEGKTLSHDELLSMAWGKGFEASVEYVRVYIGALRKKLEATPAKPRHIITETSMGYRFVR